MNGFTIVQTKDDISKSLAKLMAKAKPATPLLRAIGVGLVGLTKQAFNDSSLRPAPWVAKKDGTPSTLKGREANLWRSIRVQAVTGDSLQWGSDRPYAAIHQLGGKTRPMPARPYMPILGGRLTPIAQKRVKEIIEAYLKIKH